MSSADPPTSPVSNTAHHGAAAMSGHIDTRTAANEVADQLYDEIAGDCHLLLVMGSFHHRAAFAEAVQHLRQTLTPGVILGTTAESVIGGEEEREGRAGLSALALRLPGAQVRPWAINPTDPVKGMDDLGARMGIDEQLKGVIMLADPFTTAADRLLPAIAACGKPGQRVPVLGAMSSGASQPGHNVLALNDDCFAAGAVGITVAGNVDIGFIVSQGCRAIGKPLVVTKAKDNVILELGGQVPMAALKEMTVHLNDRDRELLNRGLLVGLVINEYKERFGRDDFLIRNVVSLDMKRGVIAVANRMRVGQTVQFHVRDATSATEDLQLLLDAEQLTAPPFAATLFTCNGRGSRLFSDPHHDAAALRQRLGEIPLAGMFAAGEIGPIGDVSFLHGHTACVGLFRKPGRHEGT